MNDKATIALLIMFAAVMGAAIFWFGTNRGSKVIKDGFEMGYSNLISSTIPLSEFPEDESTEPKRQIGFHRDYYT